MKPQHLHSIPFALRIKGLLLLFCVLLSIAVLGQTPQPSISGPAAIGIDPTILNTYTLTVPAGVTPIDINWSVNGDLKIVSANGGTSISVVSFDKSGKTGGRSRGRINVSYVNSKLDQNICGRISWGASLDIFKMFEDAFPITGPECVSAGQVVTYSVPPYVSANILTEFIGLDEYRWTLPTDAILLYTSADNSSVTFKAGLATSSSKISVDMGVMNMTNAFQSVLPLKQALTEPVFASAPPTCLPTNVTSFPIAVTAVAGVTYEWTLPPTWSFKTGTENSPSITVTPDAGPGTIRLTMKSTSVGCSEALVKDYKIDRTLSAVNSISGPGCVIPGTAYTYTVVGATIGIKWTVPTGWTITSNPATTPTITVVPGLLAVAGTITAQSRTCGTFTLSQNVSIAPSNIGSIAGATCITPSLTLPLTYSVAPVPEATSYQWTFPTGWIVVGSATGNTIALIPNGKGGTISVRAVGCSTSPASLIAVQSPPATPGVISGPTCTTAGTAVTYSIQPVTNAIGYQWTLPTGWTGTSSSNTITVTPNTASGTIKVKALGCVNSADQSLAVKIAGNGGYTFTVTNIPIPDLMYEFYVLRASPEFDYTGLDLKWILGGVVQSISTFVTVPKGTNPNDLCVTLSRASDCLNTTVCGSTSGSPARISQSKAAETTALEVAPNPVDRILEIKLPASEQAYHLVLIDQKGTIVKVLHQQTGTIQVDMSSFAAGTYRIVATDGKNKWIQQLIKQ